MSTEDFQRKLTAILSADVVGYSLLMQDNEEATVRTLNKYKEMIFGHIERHYGRLIDSPGDNLLAEFASVVDAVRCAVRIQEDLKANNEGIPTNRKMEFRIGINIGDVIQDGERIYGDGVNVAARIESLADAGGICISGTAYDQVRTKLDLGYEYLGEHNVKNITVPVRVYRIETETEAATAKVKEKKSSKRIWQRAALSVVVIFILGSVAIWYFSFRQSPFTKDVGEGPKTIAVLPFVDLSPEKDQEYFVDGLSEELLNTLTKIPDLLVTARTSSFAFKGTDKTVQEIAGVLGVENILEGSVRKAGNTLRISAQLIRATDGFHLWSETYDRELKDIFAVQEDIATAVANELKLTLGIEKSFKHLGGTDDIEAYELYLIAKAQTVTSDFAQFSRALESINAALELDPEFALGWSVKANIHAGLALFGPAKRAVTERDAALLAANKAIELDPNLAEAYFSSGLVKFSRGDFIEADSAFHKALALRTNPLSSTELFIPVYYHAVGNFERAHELLKEIRKNDPLDQLTRANYLLNLGYLGDMQRAEEEYKHGKALFGDQWDSSDNFMWLISHDPRDVMSIDEMTKSVLGYFDDYFGKEIDIDSPEAVLAELHKLYKNYNDSISGQGFMVISTLAAYFGDPEFAMEAAEKAISLQPITAFELWAPLMREVRQTPRFKEFVREIGLVDYWNEFGWPDICYSLENGDFDCD